MATLSSPQNAPRIAYLIKTFPKVSETFIRNEILSLEQAGLSLHVFSMNPPAQGETDFIPVSVRTPVSYLRPSRKHWLERVRQVVQAVGTHARLMVELPQNYVKAVRFLIWREEGFSLSLLLFASELARQLQETKISHLHAHFATKPTDVAELAHLLTGIPFSFTAHAKDIYLSPPTVLDRKIHHATFVVTCTEYNRTFLQQLSSNGTPIHRVYHGLDIERFNDSRAHASTGTAQPPLILSVGRLREKKGFPTLLHACALLKQRGYRFTCSIIGYGPLQSALARLIDDLDLAANVTLLGKKPHDEVLALYRKSSIFTLPCQITEDGDRDGIPNVLLEAMAMKVPVISTDISGIPELVCHEHNGLLVPTENPNALSDAMASLLDSPELCRTLSEAGYQTVCRNFSQQLSTRTLLHLFNPSELDC